jgi:DNA-binding transcriptional regulator YiaG
LIVSLYDLLGYFSGENIEKDHRDIGRFDNHSSRMSSSYADVFYDQPAPRGGAKADHQDWTPVVLSGKKPISHKPAKIEIQDRSAQQARQEAIQIAKVENETENFHVQRIPMALSQEILRARCAQKLSQKELAQRMNLQASVITSYENGTAIPNHQILQKISRTLGVQFQTKIPKKTS